ncbi:hypothetical protein C488_08502 [Natrinema pellirubrum DSM 15624]|uniref:Uncharacterized protein n=1 Tax=Natrinema pellirubrum (strain DSM 15624 / CIP 106293 / JCM 10476 / NCIMB 786 / 157) TaxID=797303 RepID=L0JT71_NATP1|nr:hypothetical protein Natpe_4085 [Natrinema pellirubrum DSM 15624]ELY76113.1 hypothetical protein C488_08502 [Natrinema pellirubrum DSM 15624]
MGDDDDLHTKDLEFIQDIITRLSENSFKIKGWSTTLIVVVLLFRTRDLHLLVAFIPLFGFWTLDAYYLKLERRYRSMYKDARTGNKDRDQFEMDSSAYSVDSISKLMLSKSLALFHGTIFILLLIYSVLVFLLWLFPKLCVVL